MIVYDRQEEFILLTFSNSSFWVLGGIPEDWRKVDDTEFIE